MVGCSGLERPLRSVGVQQLCSYGGERGELGSQLARDIQSKLEA